MTSKRYNLKLTNELCYLIGALFGDGEIQFDRIRFGVHDLDFAEKLRDCMQKQFSKIIKIKKRRNFRFKDSHLYHVVFNSRFVGENLKYSLDFINRLNEKELLCSFLSGCYDAEGSVDKNRNRIRLSVRNKVYSDSIVLALKKVNIDFTYKKVLMKTNPSVKAEFYIIRIYGKDNLRKFYENIPFSIERKRERLMSLLNARSSENPD